MSTDNTNNLFMSLAQFVRMPAGMSDIDRRTKLMLNALEAALPCGFTQAVSPPTPPLLRKKYIVPSGASGDWAGHDGEIALYDAANQCWTFFEPNDGQLATMQAGNLLYYDGDSRKWSAVPAGEGESEKYVKKSGDAMTGPLTLSGEPTADLHAATKKYADSKASAQALTAHAANSSIHVSDVDKGKWNGMLPKTGGTMTGPLMLPADPTANLQAATKQYVDAAVAAGGGSSGGVTDAELQTALADYVPKAGGTMTGALTLPGAPTSNLHAATKQYVDEKVASGGGSGGQDLSGYLQKSGGTMTGALTLSGAPTANLHAATKSYVDAAASGKADAVALTEHTGNSGIHVTPADKTNWNGMLPKAGGTMTGALTLPGAPTSNLHAATKKYVDDKVAASGGGGSGGGTVNDDYQHSSTAVKRTVLSRLRETVTEGDYTDAKARVKASFGKPLTYPLPKDLTFTVYGAGADFSSLAEAFEKLAGWRIPSTTPVTLNVAKGVYTETRTIFHDSQQEGLNVNGVATTVTLTGTVSCEEKTYTDNVGDNWKPVGVQFKYYHVTYQLQSAAGLSPGEFLLIRDGATDTDAGVEFYAAYGGHEILSVDTAQNRVTVISFNHLAVPLSFPGSSIQCQVVQSVLRYDASSAPTSGTTAFWMRPGGYIGTLDKIALVGRCFPVTNGNRGPYEYQEPINYYGVSGTQDTRITFGTNSVLCGFPATNALTSGCLNFYGCTSNSWGHNLVYGANGCGAVSRAVVHGGFLDGICIQDGGTIALNSVYLIGNARNGVTFSQGSFSAALGGIRAIGNGTLINTNTGEAQDGSASGIAVGAGGNIVTANAVCALNKGYGIRVLGILRAQGAKCFNNTLNGLQAIGTAMVMAGGAFYGNATSTNYASPDKKVDVWAADGALINVGKVVNSGLSQTATFLPALNTIARNGSVIYGNHNGATMNSLSIGTSSTFGTARNVTFQGNGIALFGGKTAAGSYTEYSDIADKPQIECGGPIAGEDVIPVADNAHSLGTSTHRWGDIWAANATINTSDWRVKDQIEACPLGLEFVTKLAPVKYKWLDYTEVRRQYEEQLFEADGKQYLKRAYTGDETVPYTFNRPHYGLIAQQLKSAYEACGQTDCAAYIKDEHSGLEGIRYEELIPVLIRAIQELTARVVSLETGAETPYTPVPIPDYGLEKRTQIEQPVEETVTLLGEIGDEQFD